MSSRSLTRISLFVTCCALTTLCQTPLSAQQAIGKDAELQIDLQTAISMALDNDIQLKILQHELSSKQSKIEEAIAARRPETNVEFGFKSATNTDIFGQTNQTVDDGEFYSGAVVIDTKLFDRKPNTERIQVAEIQAKVQEINYQIAKRDATKLIVELFFTTLLNQRLLRLAESRVESERIHVNQARKLYQSGKSTRFDLMRAQMVLSTVETERVSKKMNLAQSMHQLCILLGCDSEKKVTLKGKLVFVDHSFDYDYLLAEALQNRLEIRRNIFLQRINRKNVNIERAGEAPSLQLFFAYEHRNQARTQDTLVGGLTLSIPVLRGQLVNSRLTQAEIQVTNGMLERRSLENTIQSRLFQLLGELGTHREIIESQRENIQLGTESLRIAEQRYETGKGTHLDVMDSSSALADAESQLLISINDHMMALIELALLTGDAPTHFLTH